MTTPEVLWKSCLEIIKGKILLENFETWFTPIQSFKLTEDTLIIAVPNNFYKTCFEENYQDLIQETLEVVSGRKLGATFLVDPKSTDEPSQKKQKETGEGKEKEEKGNIEIKSEPTQFSANLNPNYTFSNFVVGNSNHFAHAAALAVAKKPAREYNPLFIYGPVGYGKTHLEHAIGNHIQEINKDARIRYFSTEWFTNDMIESIRKYQMPAFRRRYRPMDILLVDDIQFLLGKSGTQEEFFYTFNALYESHKQIVVSSDQNPRDMQGIEERLRSRFESGLIVEIKPANLETKAAILYEKAESQKIKIPRDVALFIASNTRSNIREMEGFLKTIVAHGSVYHRPINLELAKEVLRELNFDREKNFTVPSILKIVASHFNIKVSDIKGKKCSREISEPRQIAMYLCREHTRSSLPDIGRGFGGKDHTTVIFSHKKIARNVKENNNIAANIREIVKKIENA